MFGCVELLRSISGNANHAGIAIAPVLLWIAEAWISCNSGWMALTQRTSWDVAGIEGLDPNSWYMVNCNHQSWVDILVLQHLLNRRIPLLKFFLKQQLIWVPVMGLAWWALDFPFMRRHSDAYLRAHPEKRNDDLKAARVACRKFAVRSPPAASVPGRVSRKGQEGSATRPEAASKSSPCSEGAFKPAAARSPRRQPW